MLPDLYDWRPYLNSWLRTAFSKSQTLLPKETYGCRLQSPPEGPAEALKTGKALYKVGATTGPTIGRFNGYKADVRLHDDGHVESSPSLEHTLIAANIRGGATRYNPPFVDYGDSGSVVFDGSGRLIGLVTGGHIPQQADTMGFVYVTPIEQVFQDIKDFFAGQVTDVRVYTDDSEST